MVRSKGEGDSRRELFHLTEQFRSEQKYFNYSRRDIANRLGTHGECEVRCIHDTTDMDGSRVAAELRLNINRRRPPRYWSASLKLHKTRIDGIDWEPRFEALDGELAAGWHRHGWDDAERSAERVKIPLGQFATGPLSVDEFLIRMCRELNVLLNSEDVGFFDELSLD